MIKYIRNVQNDIDQNYQTNKIYYKNLDILKYISAILIILLHLRPFYNHYESLDFLFNNIITRICVPIFFAITGYFIAKKSKEDSNYHKGFIHKTTQLYLSWSILYIPILIGYAFQHMDTIQSYIINLQLDLSLMLLLSIFILPIFLTVVLLYSGVYYHLWYFPALMISIIVLKKWEKVFSIKSLLWISFILLLFGATETYYGVFPIQIQDLLSIYYSIFFTTRNFLFFGLFYVVLGYYMGSKGVLYSRNCFVKLLLSFLLLFIETSLLHGTNRLNSNILLSCIPLTYYIFISCIYITNTSKTKFSFSGYSKYYFLIHPMIIFLLSFVWKGIIDYPFFSIFLILFLTHVLSFMIMKYKKTIHFIQHNVFLQRLNNKVCS